jgi:Methyltransferase domain
MSPPDLEAYLDDLPRFHTWDLGVTWNTGGFYPSQLRMIQRVVDQHFPRRPVRVLETGAGNSTVTFLHLRLVALVAIAPSADLRDRILAYCAEHEIDVTTLDFRVERSEIALPSIALGAGRDAESTSAPEFDVVLLDGGHGWPTVFVDFCYVNMMMRAGSLLLLDDTQLHSVAELSRLLKMQPGFTFLEEVGKLQVWKKDDDQRFLPEHSREPYIIAMTKRADRTVAQRLRRLVALLLVLVRRAKRLVLRRTFRLLGRIVPPGRLGRPPAPPSSGSTDAGPA